MISLTLEEYHSAIASQNKPIGDVTYQCPHCKTLQSALDLLRAGAGKSLTEVSKYIGSSCIGRWDKSKGCDFTLCGLLQFHELEIIDDNCKIHPRFIPISAEQCL